MSLSFFFFNDTATTEIYTLSLHDALPIYRAQRNHGPGVAAIFWARRISRTGPSGSRRASRSRARGQRVVGDRKSTRLNSSHLGISYAVFCLKKKKTQRYDNTCAKEMYDVG